MKGIKELYSQTSVGVRASVWYVICSMLQKAIAFLTTPIFTRLMSVKQYGQVTVYTSWVEVFMIFATLDIFYGVFNNALLKHPDDRDQVTSSMQGLCTTLTLVFLCVYLLFRQAFNAFTGMSTTITLFLFGELLFVPAFRLWSVRERYEYRYRVLVFLSVLMAVLAPAIGIPAVIYFEQKGYARIITSVLTQVVVSIILYISIFRKGKRFFHKEYWKYALWFNLPLIPHYLSSIILNQSDRIMIDKLCGTDKAGIYGLAYTIGALVIIFNQSIMGSFTPFTYENLKKHNYDTIRVKSNYLIVFIAIASVSILMATPEILAILGGEQYREGIWIIAPIANSFFFRFLYSLYGNIEFYYEENYFIMISSVLCALLNIVTNYVFIRMYGFLAAGYTTLACYALYAFAHFMFSQRVLKKHTELKQLYSNGFIAITSFSLIAVSALVMMLFSYPVIRGLLFVILALLALIYRKPLLKIVTGWKKNDQNCPA